MIQLQDNMVVRTALRRPITMVMLLASAVVLGVLALSKIPLELIPSGFSPPFMSVQVPYGNATARDVEEKITRPLEQQLATTPGLDEISSVSASGNSRVTLVFDGDADMDVAYREVRDRVARVRPDLPDDVERVDIHKQSGASIPVAFYGVNWDESVEYPNELIDKHLVRNIERIDGVGMVNIWGETDPEILIQVNRSLADAANLNIFDLVQTLGPSNFNLASGTVRDDAGKYLVRSMAEYQSVEELENVVVGPNDLRLKDVADVTYGRPDTERYDRYNGRPSMVLFVVKESQANTVEVCEKIKQAVEEAKRHPALSQFGVESIFSQGDTIVFSLRQVMDAGLQGGGLAFLVLLFFLRRLRLTLTIALAIPLSLFLSLPFMYFTGQTVNLVSLIGLMICVGLVVDNSVVVAENIGRYRRRGLGPYAAALQGAGEVALAVTLATMTTMIVFLPSALLSSGPTQFFMIRMVAPVCVSLLASLFVALILIPLTSAMLLGNSGPSQSSFAAGRVSGWRRLDARWKDWMGRAYDSTLGRANEAYGRLLRLSLRRRMDVVLISILAMGSMYIPWEGVDMAEGQNFGSRQVNVFYSLPSETTLEEADEFFRGIETLVEGKREEYNIAGNYVGFDSTFGRINFFFNPPRPDERSFKEMGEELVELLPEKPGWEKHSQFADSDGSKDDAFVVALYGDEHEVVQDAKAEIERALSQITGVVSSENRGEDKRRRDELALTIDRTMGERLGVSAGLVANTVAYAIRGSPLPRYRAEDREINVTVRYRKQDREDLKQLLQFKVPTQSGDSVPIQVLTTKMIREGEARLVRNNKRVAAVVRLELDSEQRLETMARIRKFLSEYQLPEGVTFDADHVTREIEDTQRDLAGAMVLGTCFIFLLMGFLFESFVLPMSVLPSIPLSFVGVWWFLYLTGENIDPLAGIGIILLLGVVVNNGIVLVDFINRARAAGLSRVEAIVQAGVLRFRPILMTALTTVGGMLPLAFSQSTGEGIPYNAFGKALVGGMIAATVLTLVVVPVTYAYLDDFRQAARQWAARVLRTVAGKK